MSEVIVVKGQGVLDASGDVDEKKLTQMYRRGIQALTGHVDLREGFHQLFTANDRIGIKINTISGKRLSSRPATSLSLALLIAGNGMREENIIIWDRTNRELKQAGYSLNMNRKGIKIFGTDANGVGYQKELVSHRNIGSLFSSIQARFITASVSLAVLKDHGLAGVTAGMKNYFGTIHNPNKYHDSHCDPFIAELFETGEVRKKHRLTILDALLVQYHRGPAYHARWAEKYEALVFGYDPVAVDSVGWQIIENLRAEKGLSLLKEEEREPVYLHTAEKLGLGSADWEKIQITIEEV
jgi:uncharacterized protein (DUF362 family)